jgi:predicted metal-dependent phosphoesterase TrpH
MPGFIDLHLHSTCSDGSFSAEEIVRKSKDLGLSHIALTDHDCVSGIQSASEYSAGIEGPVIIPGVELSSFFKSENVDILAYFIPLGNALFNGLLSRIRKVNYARLVKTIETLSGYDVPISIEDLPDESDPDSFMSPKIIGCLFDKGFLSTHDEARKFLRNFLSPGAPAFFNRDNSPKDIIETCREIGCITSLAHPHKLHDVSIIDSMIETGVNGLEYFYPGVPEKKKVLIMERAMKHNLLLTGGSDFHGRYSHTQIGDGNVPDSVVTEMIAFLDKS